MYKKLADAELPNENVSPEMKSNYIILLQKSLSALHLTLDRLRSPQNAGNHPLSLELEYHLQEVENCLMREDSTFTSGMFLNIDCFYLMDFLFLNFVFSVCSCKQESL